METTHARNPWAAGVLSGVAPGLGQFYNRQWGKGAAFLIGALALDVALGISSSVLNILQSAASGAPPENLGGFFVGSLALLAVAVWSIADAVRTAKKS
ncbi:MAG: hypothetical protein EPO02_09020 [Nitrospirae bacterium]|nr:MAG: hypothetical protein EPO02_09020 [Nitrospirota bacterium]